MNTKSILKLLSFIFILGVGFACAEEEPVNYQGKNEIFVALKSNDKATTVTLADAPVEVAVYLTSRLEQPLTLDLKLEGEAANNVVLSASSVTIPAGQNMAIVTISRKQDLQLLQPVDVKLSCTLPTTISNLSLRSGLLIKLQPELSLAHTPEQLKLIEGYKTKFGIDLTRILGKVVCNGTMTFAGSDGDYFSSLTNYTIENQTMIVRLSEKATADQPILTFASNALGLSQLFGDIYNHSTILDSENFYDPTNPNTPPASKEIVEAVNWSRENYTKETFDVVLDNIRVNTADKTKLDFLGTLNDFLPAGDPRYASFSNIDIQVVPFQYKSSVLDRIYAYIKGSDERTTTFTQANVDPHQLLNVTKIDRNDYETESEPNYVTPAASLDLTAGTMSFTFPFDIDKGTGASYMKFQINCKKL